MFNAKKLIAFFLTFCACAIMTQTVLAQPNINELTQPVGEKAGYDTKVDKYEVSRIIGRVVQGAMVLIGMIFLVLTIYAGFLWMTAGGNEESVTKAQDILKQSVIGLIIVLSAYGITVFVAVMMSSTTDTGFWGVFSNGQSTSLGRIIDRATN